MKSVSRMATSVIHKTAHPLSSSKSDSVNTNSTSPPSNHAQKMETAQQEKEFVAHYADQTRSLRTEEIQEDRRNKELGHSSKSLSVEDFELVRTLGTGMSSSFLLSIKVLYFVFPFAGGTLHVRPLLAHTCVGISLYEAGMHRGHDVERKDTC